MTLLSFLEKWLEETPPAPPRYGDTGWVIVKVAPTTGSYDFDYTVIDDAPCTCTFWINEGEGWNYWLDQVGLPGLGVYLITGIVGRYLRGDGYTTDDDVRWDFDTPRRMDRRRAKRWLRKHG